MRTREQILITNRAASKRHYLKNKDEYIERSKKRRDASVAFVRKIKEENACTDCKKFYPYYVMDFDHLKDKVYDISNMAGRRNLNQIKEELEKCELVCSNCHRIRTHSK